MKRVSRRDFLKLVGAGALGMIARPGLAGALGKLDKGILDGSFASDVVQCYDANATNGSTINQPIVQVMMDESIKALTAKVDEMHGHMFVGNGNPAITTRLAKLEQIIGGVVWLAGAALTATIGLIVDRIMHAK